MSASSCAENFNILSNDHGCTYKCDFSVFGWKFPFWANLVKKTKQKKIKIVSLSGNLIPRLIRIRRIQWWCPLFSVLDRKHTLRTNLIQKIKIVSLSWNLVPTLIRICRIQWWCSLFSALDRKHFLGKFGPKNQNCQFKLKFGT